MEYLRAVQGILFLVLLVASWPVVVATCFLKGKRGTAVWAALSVLVPVALIGIFFAFAYAVMSEDEGEGEYLGLGLMGLMLFGVLFYYAAAAMVVGVIAAVRLAKPGSRWATRRYGPEKLALAQRRFTAGLPPPPPPPPPPPLLPPLPGPDVVRPSPPAQEAPGRSPSGTPTRQ